MTPCQNWFNLEEKKKTFEIALWRCDGDWLIQLGDAIWLACSEHTTPIRKCYCPSNKPMWQSRYPQSGGKGWEGSRRRPQLPSQRWWFSLGRLQSGRCFHSASAEPGSGLTSHSSLWQTGPLCSETLQDKSERTQTQEEKTFFFVNTWVEKMFSDRGTE